MAKRRVKGTEDNPEDKKIKVNKAGFRKALQLFQFIQPYKWIFIVGMLFLVLSSATTLSFPMLIGEMTRVMEGNSDFTLNQVTLFFGVILLLQGVFSFFRVYFFAQVSELASADIRSKVFNKFITLPIYFFEQRRVGELTSRITADVTAFQNVLSLTLAEFFRQIVTLIVGVAIITYISWKLTIFMLLTFPVLVGAALIFGKYIRKLSKEVQDKLAETNVIVEESLQSISIVKGFTNEHLEAKKYGSAMQELVRLALRTATLRGSFISFFIVGLFGGIIAVVWYGGGLVQEGSLQLADLLTFLFYTTFIGGSMSGLGDIYTQLQRTIGASERLLEIMEEESEIDLESVVPDEPIQGAIAFDEVSFSYPSRKDIEVLQNISIQIKSGEKVALVGQSGAGKSTVVQLLMRFYPTYEGVISIDGADIKDKEISEIRNYMAIVPQEVILFGGTIYENILYGQPTATEEEVLAAAKKANALEFIKKFPEQMNTIVGERGVKLSGGQRQRIAIARAILKDPKILLLDEATSALDSESEHLVQEALNTLMQGRTTIIIAHRLATIKDVDKIFVLHDGRIAESGDHQDLLLKKDGIYANLVKMQFSNSSDN